MDGPAGCEGQTSASGKREHKEKAKEIPPLPKGWAVLSQRLLRSINVNVMPDPAQGQRDSFHFIMK